MKKLIVVIICLSFLFAPLVIAGDSLEVIDLKIQLITEKIKRLDAEYKLAKIELQRLLNEKQHLKKKEEKPK